MPETRCFPGTFTSIEEPFTQNLRETLSLLDKNNKSVILITTDTTSSFDIMDNIATRRANTNGDRPPPRTSHSIFRPPSPACHPKDDAPPPKVWTCPLNPEPTPSFEVIQQEEQLRREELDYHKQQEQRSGKSLWSILHKKLPSLQIHRTDSTESSMGESFILSNLEFSLRDCILAIVAYLLLGTAAYTFCFEQNWTIVESLYFSVVTFTTVGYGDFAPTTHNGRLFTSIFVILGVASLGIALGVIGNKLVEAQIVSIKAAQTQTNTEMLSVFDSTPTNDIHTTASSTASQTDRLCPSSSSTNQPPTQQQEWWEEIKGSIQKYSPIIIFLFSGSFIIAYFEGWNWSQAIYYCIMTATTVGYGDLVPTKLHTKLITICYIPLAVGCMGVMLSNVANVILNRKRSLVLSELGKKQFTMEDLLAMDADGDGGVSMLEYVEFMLVSMQKVDKELLDRLHDQFRAMDVTGDGRIEKDDLKLLARRKLQQVENKLELSNYKSLLLSKCKNNWIDRSKNNMEGGKDGGTKIGLYNSMTSTVGLSRSMSIE